MPTVPTEPPEPPRHPVPPAGEHPPFEWTVRRTGMTVAVYLVGDLDLSTATALHKLLLHVATTGTAISVVLDFTRVRFVDAHSVNVIEQAWAMARVRDRVLRVRGLHGLPARVFDILGLRRWLCQDEQDGQPEPGGGAGRQPG